MAISLEAFRERQRRRRTSNETEPMAERRFLPPWSIEDEALGMKSQ
jgi:hypothetical protein